MKGPRFDSGLIQTWRFVFGPVSDFPTPPCALRLASYIIISYQSSIISILGHYHFLLSGPGASHFTISPQLHSLVHAFAVRGTRDKGKGVDTLDLCVYNGDFSAKGFLWLSFRIEPWPRMSESPSLSHLYLVSAKHDSQIIPTTDSRRKSRCSVIEYKLMT